MDDIKRNGEHDLPLTARQRAFLEGLRALSVKHGLVISGRGCCGSPRVDDIDAEDAVPEAGYVMWAYGEELGGECLEWMAPGDIDWERKKERVVR